MTFIKLATKPNLHSVEDMETVYVIMSNSIPAGWVAKHKSGEWCAWNSYGDFWTSYARSRDAAVAGMLDASWRHFVRAK
jgi:hypothetical protein